MKGQALEFRDDVTEKFDDLRRSIARQVDASKEFVGDKKDELFASLSNLEKNLGGLGKKLGRG